LPEKIAYKRFLDGRPIFGLGVFDTGIDRCEGGLSIGLRMPAKLNVGRRGVEKRVRGEVSAESGWEEECENLEAEMWEGRVERREGVVDEGEGSRMVWVGSMGQGLG